MTFAEGAATPAELIVSSTQAGYPARLSEPADIESHSTRLVKEAHALSRRMGSAAALALPVLIVEMGGLVVCLWPDQRAATSPGRRVMFETPTGAQAGSPSQQNERKEEAMNNGDIDRRFGLPPKTIRYNEDIGLFRPQCGENGYRSFREQDPHKLAFLGRARALGFTIENCRTLTALYEESTVKACRSRRWPRNTCARLTRRSRSCNPRAPSVHACA